MAGQGGGECARKSVIARIRNAEADGLGLRDYNLPNFVGLATDALAEADIKLTHTVLTFARHLQAGRFPYHFVSRNIQLPQAPPEPSEVLSRISDAVDAGKALDEFGPQQEPYRKLKAALAQLRAKPGAAAMAIAEGPVLSYSRKSQMEDPRVPLLRERLKIAGGASDRKYDATVMDAVKKYQEANHLPATGSLDARTVRELNSSTRDSQIDTIIANMERWRWYPRDLGDAHVLVNQPDFTLKVMHNGVQVWSTRVVIGKTSMPTPLLSETMKSITLNPTWNVPQSIVQNEYLPALAQDPTVLARMGLRVSYSGGEVQITQPPGPGTRSGASVSTSRTGSLFTSMTPRTNTCSARISVPRATAACACRIRQSTPKSCSTLRVRTSTGRRRRSPACSAGWSRTFRCSRRRSGFTSPIKPRLWMMTGNCRCAVTSTTMIAARSLRSKTSAPPSRRSPKLRASKYLLPGPAPAAPPHALVHSFHPFSPVEDRRDRLARFIDSIYRLRNEFR